MPAKTDQKGTVSRDENGRWLKGTKPPNPKGRPREMSPIVKQRLDAVTPKALDELEDLMFGALDEKTRLAAIKVWLSYALGLPKQVIEAHAGVGSRLAAIVRGVVEQPEDDDDSQPIIEGTAECNTSEDQTP